MPLDGAILGEGIYAPREAARLIGASSTDVIRWTRGSGTTEPIWKAHYQFLNDATEISFIDLVELRVVRALRSASISLQAIRFAIRYAKENFGIDRPLSSREFKIDGAEILMNAVEEDGDYVSLSKKRAGQKVFSKLIEQSVSGLEYEGQHVRRWRPNFARHVVIDPNRSFGSPLIDECGVSTGTLYKEWQKTRSHKYVGQLYEIDDALVKDAVAYEGKLTELQKAQSGQGSI